MRLITLDRYGAPRWLPALGLIVAAGCSSTSDGDGTTPPGTMPPGTTPPAATQGSGELDQVRAVGQQLSTPFDASPSPDADAVYFTAIADAESDEASGALFRAETTGGTPQMLASGFNAPIGLVVSTNGDTVYVADVSVQSDTDDRVGGVIYSVASTGGTPAELAPTVGYRARSMDLVAEDGSDQLYFSGNDPADMEPGVFKIAASGGAVSTVLKGGPLSDPSGLAVTADGTVYVADTSASDNDNASILKIENGQATKLVEEIRVGYPAGIALSQDSKFLLVSGHVEGGVQAAVYRIDLATGAATAITTGLEGNQVSGGVHRAHNADTYAWSNADLTGTVYIIGTKFRRLN